MLEFQNVTIYRKKKKILDNFNLKLQDGTIFGLVGSDQEARAAVLQAAVGAVRPYRGRVIFGNQTITSSPNAYLRMGYMPRQGEFYEQLTVKEYFDVFLALYKVNGRYRERRVEEILDFLEMGAYRNSFIGEIPAEKRSFLSLGKAILHEPSWLFLDEPMDGLTPVLRKKMTDLLGMLWEQGRSLVISSHLYPELAQMFSEIAVIEGSQIVFQGTVDSVYEEVLRQSPIRLRILDGMDNALRVLRENDLVERVTVDKEDVILLFSGGDTEEAQLLTDLVKAGALVHHFMRDPMDMDQQIWR